MTKKTSALVNHRVVALAYEGLCTFEFGIAVEIFGLPRPEMGEAWYQFSVAALDEGPIRATGGIRLMVDGTLALLEQATTIIIPGWRGMDCPVPAELCHALRKACQRGARIVSICSGVFVLAAAGLLNGKRATTHWRYIAALQSRFPGVEVVPDVLYIDNGRLLTSAGSAAGIDLCLHIVRGDYGPAAANLVARRLVVQPHRHGAQAQFIEKALPVEYESERLSSLFDHLYQHLADSHTIASLAARVGMSERTFLRRFFAATAMTPSQWLLTARLKQCRELLENTGLSIEIIAERSGFGTATTLRHHFKKTLNTTPAAYRKSFTQQSG